MSKTVCYLRVSTSDQDIEKNKADILKLAASLKNQLTVRKTFAECNNDLIIYK